jgi:hypothetical protein
VPRRLRGTGLPLPAGRCDEGEGDDYDYVNDDNVDEVLMSHTRGKDGTAVRGSGPGSSRRITIPQSF